MVDLTVLRSHLTDLGTPLVLATSDALLPKALRDLLGTTPAAGLSLTPAPDGITLESGKLTVAGSAGGEWPVEGFSELTVSLTAATLVIRDGDTAPIVTVQVTGTLALGGGRVAVRLVPDLAGKTAGWKLTITGTMAAMSATDLLLLGLDDPGLAGGGLSLLDSAVDVDPAKFALRFYPGTDLSPSYTFTLTVAGAQWAPLPTLPSVDAVDIVAYVLPGAYTVELVAELTIDGVRVDVGVSVGPRPQWTVFLRPPDGGSLPGLAALVGLLSGAANGLADQTRTALGTVGDDSSGFDAAITGVTGGLSWKAPSLDYVEIASVLTLRGLKLAVSLLLPDITLRGSLYQGQAANVAAVLASFGLPADGVPTELAVTAVDFSAQLDAGVYRLAMTVDGLWAVGPLAVEEVAFSVAYSPFDQFTASVAGVLAFGESTRLQVSGGHSAQDGWWFSGATDGDAVLDVGEVLAELAGSFGIDTVPDALRTLTLTEVSASFVGSTGAFSLTCGGFLEIADTALTLRVSADLARGSTGQEDPSVVTGSKGYTARFHGLLTYGDLDFDVLFDLAGTGAQTFVASYSRSGDAVTVDLRDLIAELSTDAAAVVPAGLSFGLKDIALIRTKPAETAPATWVVGLDLSAAIALTGLPVVGPHLPADATLAVQNLQVLYASAPLPADTTARVNVLLGPRIVPLPGTGLPGGTAVLLQVAVGGTRQTLSLGLAPADTPIAPALAPPAAVPAAGEARSAVLAAPVASGQTAPATPRQAQTDDNVLWYKVQAAYGPVQVDRAGFAYRHDAGQPATLAVLVDAAISVGGLTLSCDGLSVRVSLSDLAAGPTFDLAGLGLSYSEGPVEISGAFLKSTLKVGGRDFTAYGGKAVIRTKTFSIGAIGSYVQLDEGPSMFVYAFLDYPIGGPAFFFVRGLAAGFGYNRRLIAPAVDAIVDFPLVAEAVGATKPSDLPGELARLEKDIPPSPGDYFLAIGVRFTSFQMIDSFLLVTIGFGHRVELNVLGLSTMVLPAADSQGTGITPIAEIQLALKATFAPDDGYFSLLAQLTPNSFLLDRACKLTGGFAFVIWFGPDHQGDFVVTAGGYHPQFVVPAHYPAVPRLGFNWQVSEQLALKGTGYFALTPGALMAGGSLSATYEDGSLRAWFDTTLDFLIAWQPYHYQAAFRLSVGASYTFSFFGTHTINVRVGTDVRFWGPEFGGRAVIDLDVISFTIDFGADEGKKATPVEWGRFRDAQLPKPAEIATIALRGGGLHSGKDADLGQVDPLGLELVTDSVIPSTQGAAGAKTLAPGTTFGIAPVGLHAGFTSRHELTITRDGVAAEAYFTFAPVTKSLPAALWGDELVPTLKKPPLVEDLLTGYVIRPLPPEEPADPPSLPLAALRAGTPLFTERDAFDWQPPAPFRPVPDAPLDLDGPASARAAIAGKLLPDAVVDLNGLTPADFLSTPQVAAHV
jgi:hypothetical protein